MLMLKYTNVYTDTGALYFDNAKEFYTQMLTRDVPMTWIDSEFETSGNVWKQYPRFEQIRMAHAN